MKVFFTLSMLLLTACNGTAQTGYLDAPEKPTNDSPVQTADESPDNTSDNNDSIPEQAPPLPELNATKEIQLIALEISSQDSNLRRQNRNAGYELKLGNSAKFQAIGLYSDGSQKDLTAQVQWQTNNPNLLQQNINEAKALATGQVKISAQFDDLSSNEMSLSITPIKKVVTWGNPEGSARIDEQTKNKLIDVVDVVASFDAFTALKANGEIVTWGNDILANSIQVNESEIVEYIDNIQTLYSPTNDSHYSPYTSNRDFFGKTKNNSYISWGSVRDMGLNRISINQVKHELTNIKKIYSTKGATAALKQDGTVIAWGSTFYGGNSSGVKNELNDVISITANDEAFAALKEDGSVVTWGADIAGGSGFVLNNNMTQYIDIKPELVNVKSIVANEFSFAALKADGSVVSWGLSTYTNPNTGNIHSYGGDSFAVQHELTQIKKVYPGGYAYAALREDGSVVTWGDANYGGTIPNEYKNELKNVQDIVGNIVAFTALKSDGSVTSWGDADFGGKIDLNHDGIKDQLTGVKRIFSNRIAFAALKEDGSVVAWGQPTGGGLLDINGDNQVDELTNVKEIYASGHAFTALKEDGTIVTWGAYANNDAIKDLTRVVDIKSNLDGFAALVEIHEIE